MWSRRARLPRGPGMWSRGARPRDALRGVRGIATDRINGVPDRIGGVAPTAQFKRYYDAPSMDAKTVAHTLRELVAEKSCDVHLFQALARRFHASAEEFFPHQIDSVLGSFAELGFFSEPLLDGFLGRLDDVVAGPSPRRVVRLLRSGAALRLEPEAWVAPLLPQVHRHVPNLHHGLPAVLASLHAIRWHDPELVELLLTQGLIVAESAGDSFFLRVFERWSRHGLSHTGAEEHAVALAGKLTEFRDTRDGLNLLAGLLRCGHQSEAGALEERLAAHLQAAPTETVVEALAWMRRLSLRGRRLWSACGDSVELALKQRRFIRDDLPDALHSLAALSDGSHDEAGFLARLLGSPETHEAARRYRGAQVFRLLDAACLVGVTAGPSAVRDETWSLLVAQMARLSRQLTLPERRRLRAALELLQDFGRRGGLGLEEDLAGMRSLPVFPLPPLLGNPRDGEIEWATSDVGAERLLHPVEEEGSGDSRRGVRFLGFGDMFAGAAPAGHVDAALSTPACRLSLRALELQGWSVDVRA